MDSPGPGRRKESLTSSITEGTSKFFSSMMAKKNGIMSDISTLSSKIENTFMPTGVGNSDSEGSLDTSRGDSGSVKYDSGNVRDDTSNTRNSNDTRNDPACTRTDTGITRNDSVTKNESGGYNQNVRKFSRSGSKPPPPRPPPVRQESIDAYMAAQREKYGDAYAEIPVNTHMSFDSPLYNGPSAKSRDSGKKSDISEQSRKMSDSCDNGYGDYRKEYRKGSVDRENSPEHSYLSKNITSSSNREKNYDKRTMSQDKPAPMSTFGKTEPRDIQSWDVQQRKTIIERTDMSTPQHKLPRSHKTDFSETRDTPKNFSDTQKVPPKNLADSQKVSESSNAPESSNTPETRNAPDGSGSADESSGSARAPHQTHRRRSSTVDEMLFDDYVDGEAAPPPPIEKPKEDDMPAVTKKLLLMGNLMSFDDEYGVHHSPAQKAKQRLVGEQKAARNARSENKPADGILVPQRVIPKNADDMLSSPDDDSSDVEYGGRQVRRSGSVDSERSWSSNFSTDSQPDMETRECMTFMKKFVERIFTNDIEAITQADKSIFGTLIRDAVGRLWFARYINSKRVNCKSVDEGVFFRLVQYFSLALFECDDSEDFSPAKTLMSMCFTFYQESLQPNGKQHRQFLYTYLQPQPIWQSLRFWNAAFFDAIQTERSRRPVCTSADGSSVRVDDMEFQENITFGQLGTFTCNMQAFGLKKDLCLEFLRKQSVIANLSREKTKLLKESIEKSIE